MLVKFKQDIVSNGAVCANTGSTGIVSRLIGSTKLQVKLDEPLNPKVTELIVPMDSAEIIEGGVRNLVLNKISVTDINLDNYELFKRECDELKGYVDPFSALQYSIQGANIAAYISKYRALLAYTEENLEREVKFNYSKALSVAAGSSQDKRESAARQDVTYQQKLTDLADIKAAKLYVNAAYDYAMNMYYLFKDVYNAEKRSIGSNDPSTN